MHAIILYHTSVTSYLHISHVSICIYAHRHRRIGVHNGSTKRILEHPFFAKLDLAAVKEGKAKPEFIPSATTSHEPLSNLMPVKPFNGDQKVFADF